jgi:hypothetical protein
MSTSATNPPHHPALQTLTTTTTTTTITTPTLTLPTHPPRTTHTKTMPTRLPKHQQPSSQATQQANRQITLVSRMRRPRTLDRGVIRPWAEVSLVQEDSNNSHIVRFRRWRRRGIKCGGNLSKGVLGRYRI